MKIMACTCIRFLQCTNKDRLDSTTCFVQTANPPQIGRDWCSAITRVVLFPDILTREHNIMEVCKFCGHRMTAICMREPQSEKHQKSYIHWLICHPRGKHKQMYNNTNWASLETRPYFLVKGQHQNHWNSGKLICTHKRKLAKSLCD